VTLDAGCEYCDVDHLTEALGRDDPNGSLFGAFTDTVHFQPWVYEELNNVLLNVLCNTAAIVQP